MDGNAGLTDGAGELAGSYGGLVDATAQLEAGSVVFVINANAGRRIPLPELESICEDATRAVGRRPYVIATQSVEEAEELALSAHDAGAAAIFACGGDGTLSTLLQGLPNGSPTALGTAPLGTANVFAYETGLVRKPREAVVAQLAALEGESGAIVTIDTGRATTVSGDGSATARRFLLMTGWGLDAAAIDGIVNSPRRRWLKRKFGEPTYFLSAVREAMRRSWALRLRVDGGEPYEVEMGMFTVGNTRMIGTWLEVNAAASAVDGQLDAILVHGAPWRALTLAGFARGGLIAKLPGVSTLRFRTLDVEPIGPPPPCHFDGELAPRGAYTVEVEPGSLKVLCPNPAAAVLQP